MSKKIVLWSAGLMVLCVISMTQAAWLPITASVSYDGSRLPTALGAIKYGGTPYTDFVRDYAASSVYETDGDIFHMSTMSPGGNPDIMWSRTNSIPSEYNFNSTAGYTVEVRMKINNATELYSGASQLTFEEYGKAAYWNIGMAYDPDISQQYVTLGSDSRTNVAVSPGWHVYRVTATNDNKVRLYIDGGTTAVVTRDMYNGEDSNLWQFGDFTSTNADWELDYVAIDNTGAIVPEPASMLILGLGSLVVAGIRKNGSK